MDRVMDASARRRVVDAATSPRSSSVTSTSSGMGGRHRPNNGTVATSSRADQEGPSPEAASTSSGAATVTPSVSLPSASTTPLATSKDIFAALVADITTYQGPGYVAVWKETIQELFATEYGRLPLRPEMLPVERKRYPTLRGKEAVCFLDLFKQIFVSNPGSFTEWKRLARSIGQELVSSKWAFTQIIRKLASQHKWATVPVLNQWAQVVSRGTQPGREEDASPRRTVFEDFMFNPERFSPEEASTLKTLCTTRLRPDSARRLREGTDDEWKVIVGITEGHIACRRMPDFLRSVMDSKERLGLYSTIQAQVEGQLVLHIGRGRDIPIIRRTTHAITDMILESAELARVNVHAIHQLLGLTKTISYNRTRRSIHFYFFSRVTAAQNQSVQIPFQGRIYTLENVHQDVSGSAWMDQRGPDGHLGRSRTEYTIVLSNLTRFHEIGRIAANFKAKIPTEFELEDLDTYTPNSRTSTAWSITFQLAGCPAFLNGVVRLLWFGTTIIIRHPGLGRQLQCLRCGHLGHPASRCQYTEAQLHGPGGVMVSEEELQAVEDLAKPFGSPEEMREMASKRLLVQQSVDAAAQAAVTPSGVSLTPPGIASPGAPALGHLESCAPARDTQAATPGTEPKAQTEQPWLSRPIRGRGRLWTHGVSPPPPTSSRLCSGAYDALRDDVDDSSVRVRRVRTEHAAAEPRTGAVSLVHAAPVPRSEDIQLTPEESARKRAAGIRGPAPVRTGPTLLAAQRAERTQLKRLIDQADRRGAHAIPMEPRPEVKPTHERDLECILGTRAVTTPATGNSLAMAVAQAASDSSMDNSDSQFEQLTACVKRGIQNVGLLNLEDQLNHDQRVAALKAVGRGWASMSPKESSHQLKWYLYDYVGTPSDRGATVPDNCWGGSDILKMAATFVRRDVYVIQFHDSGRSKWRCQRYHPTTVTRHGRVVKTATAYPLSVLACIDDIQAAKIEQPTLTPLVLRVWGRHYFALTHTEHASSSLSRIDGPAASDPDNPPCGLSPGSDPNPTWPPIFPARQRPVDGRVNDSTSPSEYPTTLVVHSQSTTQCTSSAAVESSLALIPERPMVLAHRSNLLARKRIHATSSGSGEADATASSLVMATAKRGRVGERPHQPHVQPPADRIDEDEWQAVWSALGTEWPSIARTPYPLIYGEVESWLNTAHLDPDILLHHARRFVFLSELLVSLDSQVLVQWTAKWRQDSLLSGLRAYKDKVKDAATEAWIDQWITSAMYREGLSRLAPLIDNSEIGFVFVLSTMRRMMY